jgi:hypothetical protein
MIPFDEISRLMSENNQRSGIKRQEWAHSFGLARRRFIHEGSPEITTEEADVTNMERIFRKTYPFTSNESIWHPNAHGKSSREG